MTTEYLSGSEVGNSINPSDTLIVTSGGSDTDFTVQGGGTIVFQSTGYGSGGYVYGYGSSGTIGEEDVLAGGTVTSSFINGGEQIVSGGIALDTTVGYVEGTATGESMQFVSDGGVAIDTSIFANIEFSGGGNGLAINEEGTVGSGGTISGTNMGGEQYGHYDNDGNEIFTNAYVTEYVLAGGVAVDTAIYQLTSEVVSEGGLIEGTTLINGGTLSLDGLAGSGEIEFKFGSGLLVINGTIMPTNDIIGVGASTAIDFTSIPFDSILGVTETEEQLLLSTQNGDYALNVLSDITYPYTLVDDGVGGTEVFLCYLRGASILTTNGNLPVEELSIGDFVITRWHGIKPILWIGRQSYSSRFIASNRSRLPVRIQRGALGEHLPAHDLFVSPGHSMLVDDTLVLASSLINGVTILQDHLPEEVHYFQIDLGVHDCVVANGTWSETYADGDTLRSQFHNVREFYTLYPEHREPDELVLCAPRPERGPKLDKVLRPLVVHASLEIPPGRMEGFIDLVPTPWKVEGWAIDIDNPYLPVLLEVLVEDEIIGSVLACDYRSDLDQAGFGAGRCAFMFFSPIRILAEKMHTIRVRRVNDKADVPMSSTCRDRLGFASVENVDAGYILRTVVTR